MSQIQSHIIRIPRIRPRGGVYRILLSSLAFLFRLIIGAVFLKSSLAKLQQPLDFLSSVYSYELVTPQLGLWIALAVPWLELATGLCLVFGVLDRGSWLMAIIILAAFTAAQASVASRGLLIPCGCAYKPIETISYRSVLTTGTLLLIAIIGFSCSLVKQKPRSNLPVLPSAPQTSHSG